MACLRPTEEAAAFNARRHQGRTRRSRRFNRRFVEAQDLDYHGALPRGGSSSDPDHQCCPSRQIGVSRRALGKKKIPGVVLIARESAKSEAALLGVPTDQNPLLG
jgi:hypothetical protein